MKEEQKQPVVFVCFFVYLLALFVCMDGSSFSVSWQKRALCSLWRMWCEPIKEGTVRTFEGTNRRDRSRRRRRGRACYWWRRPRREHHQQNLLLLLLPSCGDTHKPRMQPIPQLGWVGGRGEEPHLPLRFSQRSSRRQMHSCPSM